MLCPCAASRLSSLLAASASAALPPRRSGSLATASARDCTSLSGRPSPANRFNVAIYTPKIFDQIRADAARRECRDEPWHQRRGRRPRRAEGARRDDRRRRAGTGDQSHLARTALRAHRPGRTIPRTSTRSSAPRSKAPPSPMFRPRIRTSATPSLHAGDGVHFTMAGYRALWQKAASVAGIPIVEASVSVHRPAASRRKRILVCRKKGSSGKRGLSLQIRRSRGDSVSSAPG